MVSRARVHLSRVRANSDIIHTTNQRDVEVSLQRGSAIEAEVSFLGIKHLTRDALLYTRMKRSIF